MQQLGPALAQLFQDWQSAHRQGLFVLSFQILQGCSETHVALVLVDHHPGDTRIPFTITDVMKVSLEELKLGNATAYEGVSRIKSQRPNTPSAQEGLAAYTLVLCKDIGSMRVLANLIPDSLPKDPMYEMDTLIANINQGHRLQVTELTSQ
jgi:hypothetical protein